MSDGLKPGWRRVKFGDVVRLNKETSRNPAAEGLERYVGLEHIEPGDLRIRSWGDIADGITFTNRFRPGQVLFGKRRAYQRKVAVADFDGVCSGDIYAFEPKDPDVLLPELLPFICQTDAFFDHAIGTSAGSLSPRTHWKHLAEHEFLLPSLDEQRRLLGLLKPALAVYERLQDCEVAREILAKSYCGGVKQSSHCPLTEIGQVARFTSGNSIRVTNLPQHPSGTHSIPVFGGNGISGWSNQYLEDLLEYFPVIGRVGQYCGVAHLVRSPAWITDNALYPKWLSPKILPQYLLICLKGAHLNRSKLGEYLPLITQKVVHECSIPLPDLHQQAVIVAAFDEINLAGNAIRARKQDAAECLSIFSSILTGAR